MSPALANASVFLSVRAVLFDVDGTLYRQPMLRALMAAELLSAPVVLGPRRAATVLRVLQTFRVQREALRHRPAPHRSLDELQYELAATHCGESTAFVRQVVDRWIFKRPLKYMRACRRSGLVGLLGGLERQGVRIGALSDYPVREKLEALGVRRHFELSLCTTDPEINAFKPDPAGFVHACARWNLDPTEVLYVGDRVEVDATGAAAAGMPCAILGDSRSGSHLPFEGFRSLSHAFAIAR